MDYPTVSNPPPPPRRALVWGALVILYLVWGSTYLGIAIAVDTIPPFLMAASRFAVAGIVLLLWSIARERRSFVLPSRREWRDTLIVAALLLGGGMGMVAYGEQTVPSGIAALLIAMMPVWVAILGRTFLGDRLPRLAIVGIVVGFGGVAILVGPSVVGGPAALDGAGLAALIVSPLCWALGSLYASRRATLPARPLVATSAQMIAGAAVLTAMAAATGEPDRLDPTTISPESLVALAYLTFVGSLIGFTAYGWLLRVAPLPWVATYAYVNPVVAVILGAAVLSEPIELHHLAAGAVIVAAVALIVTTRGRMAGPQARTSRPRDGREEVEAATPAAAPGSAG